MMLRICSIVCSNLTTTTSNVFLLCQELSTGVDSSSIHLFKIKRYCDEGGPIGEGALVFVFHMQFQPSALLVGFIFQNLKSL